MRPVGDKPVALITMRVCRLLARTAIMFGRLPLHPHPLCSRNPICAPVYARMQPDTPRQSRRNGQGKVCRLAVPAHHQYVSD